MAVLMVHVPLLVVDAHESSLVRWVFESVVVDMLAMLCMDDDDFIAPAINALPIIGLRVVVGAAEPRRVFVGFRALLVAFVLWSMSAVSISRPVVNERSPERFFTLRGVVRFVKLAV